MAFKDFTDADPLYRRLGKLCDALESKMDRALYSHGKAALFITRLHWLLHFHEIQQVRARELRVAYDKAN